MTENQHGISLDAALSHTEFLRPERSLHIGLKESGFPRAAFECLYLKSGGLLVRVREPKHLVGHVEVRSEEQALGYVRLFTSPATVRALRPAVEDSNAGERWLEVVPVSAVNSEFVFGRSEYITRLQHVDTHSGYREYGVLTEDEWRKSGLTLPTVRRAKDSFLVTRFLFTVDEYNDPMTHTVHRVAETVSPEGRLQRDILETRKLSGVVLSLRAGD